MSIYTKFYPNKIFSSVLDITLDFLDKNGIKAILLDVDNTLIDYDNNILDGIEEWVKKLKKEGIKFCIVSNTRHKEKTKKMSRLLDIPYIYFAKKPFKNGFQKAKQLLKIEESNEIAAVGDQIMTDVYGANRCNMYSILVKPITSKDILITRFNRIMERKILKEYYKAKQENKN